MMARRGTRARLALLALAVATVGCAPPDEAVVRVEVLHAGAVPSHLRVVLPVTGGAIAAGFGGVVARSTDEGRHWSRVVSGTTRRIYGGDSAGDRVCLVGERGTVLDSSDGGRTFSPAAAPTQARLVAALLGERRTIVAGDGGIVLERSSDEPFRIVHNAADEVAGIRALVRWGDDVMAAGYDGYALLEETAGLWRELPAGDLDALYGLTRKQDGEVWGCGSFGALVRGTATPGRFEPVPSPTRAFLRAIHFDGAFGLAAGLGTVAMTHDGGTTWKSSLTAYPAQLLDVRALDDRRAVVAGEYGVVLVTADSGATWSTAASAFHLLAVAWPADDLVVAAGIRGHAIRSVDGGRTFQPAATNTRAAITSLAFASPTRGIAICDDGATLLTTDGGATFARRPLPGGHRADAAAALPDGSFVVVGRDGTYLLGDGDGFTQATPARPVAARSVTAGDDRQPYWCAGENGLLAHASRIGGPWLALYTGVDRTLFGVAAAASRLYAVGDSGSILSSSHGGRGSSLTLHEIEGGATLRAVAASPNRPELAIAVGDGGVIACTRDGGLTWRSQALDTPQPLRAVAVRGRQAMAVGDWETVYRLSF